MVKFSGMYKCDSRVRWYLPTYLPRFNTSLKSVFNPEYHRTAVMVILYKCISYLVSLCSPSPEALEIVKLTSRFVLSCIPLKIPYIVVQDFCQLCVMNCSNKPCPCLKAPCPRKLKPRIGTLSTTTTMSEFNLSATSSSRIILRDISNWNAWLSYIKGIAN